jgi:hypothetical protein
MGTALILSPLLSISGLTIQSKNCTFFDFIKKKEKNIDKKVKIG